MIYAIVTQLDSYRIDFINQTTIDKTLLNAIVFYC